jgi:acetyl esterase/lipase
MKTVTPDRNVHDLRQGLEARTTMLSPAHGVDVREESIAGIDCEIHVPQGCADAPVIYYLHGGAYIMGSPGTHRRLVSFIARSAGMRAVLPDYRLAPENRFPAALEDSLAVYRALLQGGLRASDIAIGGDSAGGNLAVSTLLSLRDSAEAMPAACFLMSPWLDLDGQGESHSTRDKIDPWFRTEHLPAIAAMFVDKSETRNPLVSPVYADAAGLPPTFIQVGDHEILLSDSIRMADHIEMAGGRAEIAIWPQMWHVFQFFVGQMPESMRAISDIGRFLRAEIDNCKQDPAGEQAA